MLPTPDCNDIANYQANSIQLPYGKYFEEGKELFAIVRRIGVSHWSLLIQHLYKQEHVVNNQYTVFQESTLIWKRYITPLQWMLSSEIHINKTLLKIDISQSNKDMT